MTLLAEVLPEDMAPAVEVAVEYVRDLLDEYPDAIMGVEQRFEIYIAVAPGEVFGTNDIWIYIPSLRLLYVIDYKHGAGKFVDVKGNFQLRFYALGILIWLLNQNPDWKIDSVALVIIQPRITWVDPVREEWVTVEEILEFGPVIGAAIEACKAPDAPLVPGEEQCRFCAAKLICPAREKQALLAVGNQFGHVQHVAVPALQRPVEMDDQKLSTILTNADAMRAYLRDCEAEGERRLRAGRDVPGHKLVEVTGQRRWEKSEEETAQELAAITGRAPQDFMKLKLRGLGEVETLLKEVPEGSARKEAAALKKARLEKMAFLTTKKSSGNLTVVSLSDPRPAVNKADAAFSDVVMIPHVTVQKE